MNKIAQDKFALLDELVRYAETHGIRVAARCDECARNTMRLWYSPWKTGDAMPVDNTRCPHHSPRRTSARTRGPVVSARQTAPWFGALRLVDMFSIPLGKEAAHRVLRDEKLLRARPP